MGGSSRADTISLLFLRPLSVFLCVFLIVTIARGRVKRHAILLGTIAAMIALVILHLAPLPPTVWQALPQRGLVASIDDAAGLSGLWRPLSLTPEQTWNALYSLAVPLSIAMLFTRLDERSRTRLIAPLLALGLACGILGLMQISGGENSPFYFYRLYNAGSPIGFFANRNHTAAFMACMLPLLAAYASRRGDDDERERFRQIVALVGTPLILLLLLLLGSRAGLLVGAIGLATMPVVFEGSGYRKIAWKARVALLAAGAAIAVGLIAIATLASRSEALDRLFASEGQDYRITTFRPVLELTIDYLPFGSGLGSFVETYQRAEPESMIEPRYLNHAHNDLLELALTGGVPALLILAAIAFFAGRSAWRCFVSPSRSSQSAVRRAAIVSLALIAAASLFDYPLRTPAMMAFGTLMLGLAVLERARNDDARVEIAQRLN